MHKAAAQIVAESVLRRAAQRKKEARLLVDHGSSWEQEHLQAIIYLWRDKHGFSRPQG